MKNCMTLSGGGGIRTPGTLASTSVFKTDAFNRSATPPKIKSQNGLQKYIYFLILQIMREKKIKCNYFFLFYDNSLFHLH